MSFSGVGRPPFSAKAAGIAVGLFGFLGLAVATFGAYRASPAEFDDAYISFRYAQSLLEGHGLVFNVEDGPLEGFTNLAWVLLTAVAMKFGSDPMVFCSTLGLLSLALSFALGLGAFRADGLLTAARFVAAGLLLFLPSLISVAGSGLETSFAGLLIVLLGLVLTREKPSLVLFGLVSLLLTATRPDGQLFVAAAAFAAVYPKTLSELRAWRTLFRRVLPFALVTLGVVLTLFVFRLAYFHELVPNTYFAKNADVNSWAAGTTYVVRFAESAPHVAAMLATWFVGGFVLRRPSRLDVYGFVALSLYSFYVVKVGGDFMSYRFAFQVLPFIFFLWSSSLEQYSWPRALTVALAGVVAVSFGAFRPELMEFEYGMQTVEVMNSFVAPGRRVGRALRGALPPDARISTTLAGAIPYEARLFTVDEWGLNDREVARQKSVPIGRSARGHLKKAPEEYLDKRRVNLEVNHPTICDCTRRCDENRPNVYLRLDGATNECVRMRYRTQTPELTKLFCAGGKFIVSNVDCSLEPMPTFSFEPAAVEAQEHLEGEVQDIANEALLKSAHGVAFGRKPQARSLDGQTPVSGARTFINGFHGGDLGTGWIDLALPAGAKRVDFLIAGGRAADSLFVGIVDGDRVLTRVGGDQTEVLKPIALFVPPTARQPRFVVFDSATAGWGHLIVGEVRVLVGSPGE